MEAWKRYLRYDDSKIVDMFVGQLKSCLECSVCGHCSVTFDPFWDLSLPIPSKSGQVRLAQCLDLFTKEEVLDGDERPVSFYFIYNITFYKFCLTMFRNKYNKIIDNFFID